MHKRSVLIAILDETIYLSSCTLHGKFLADSLKSLVPGTPYSSVVSMLVKAGWQPRDGKLTCGEGYYSICSESFRSERSSACLMFKPTASTEEMFEGHMQGEC